MVIGFLRFFLSSQYYCLLSLAYVAFENYCQSLYYTHKPNLLSRRLKINWCGLCFRSDYDDAENDARRRWTAIVTRPHCLARFENDSSRRMTFLHTIFVGQMLNEARKIAEYSCVCVSLLSPTNTASVSKDLFTLLNGMSESILCGHNKYVKSGDNFILNAPNGTQTQSDQTQNKKMVLNNRKW